MAVWEAFVALACETTTCTVTDFSGGRTCASALQAVRKKSPLRTFEALLIVSPASKRIPQPEANLIRGIRIAIQGVSLRSACTPPKRARPERTRYMKFTNGLRFRESEEP